MSPAGWLATWLALGWHSAGHLVCAFACSCPCRRARPSRLPAERPQDEGDEKMREVSDAIREGAAGFLSTQCPTSAWLVDQIGQIPEVFICLLCLVHARNHWRPVHRRRGHWS